MSESTKIQKTKGPIRTEAIAPFIIVVGLIVLYFLLFFDSHLKRALELGGYHAIGAEVNIASVSTSFIKAKIEIKNIEITNSIKPTHNTIKIGDIRFGLTWDALLRAKFVIDEIAVENIEVDTPRKKPGRVKPPPPPTEAKGPGLAEELKSRALSKLGSENEENVLGNISNLMQGSSGQEELQKIEGNLKSEELNKSLQTDFKTKEAAWNDRLKSLPQSNEFKDLADRLKKVKTSNFKSADELKASLEEIDKIFKEADSKFKVIASAGKDLDSDIKKMDADLKSLDQTIKDDIKNLETRLKIPSLDPKNITHSLFLQYVTPYMQKADLYKGYADKYLPPKFTGKRKSDPDELPIQPHPRANGVTYEFGHRKGYPLFWIKNVSVSSKAAGNPNMGDLDGKITDITSNQKIIGRPTVASLSGSFPGKNWQGLSSRLEINNLADESLVAAQFGLASFPVDGRPLVEQNDINIGFNQASGSINAEVRLQALKELDLKISNQLKNVTYKVEAKNSELQTALNEILIGIPTVSLDVKAQGTLPKLPIDISSNLGGEILKGLEKQIAKKIAELKAKIEKMVNDRIASEKEKLESQANQLKSQIESELKTLQGQVEEQKKLANSKKSEAEKSAKKGVEDQLKKALGGKDPKKAVDDLKKKLGL